MTVQAKLIALLLSLLLFMVSNLGSYFYGHHKGVQFQIGVQAGIEVKRATATTDSVVKHSQEIVDEVKKDQTIGAKANERYETAVEELHKSDAADRKLIHDNGGLYFTARKSDSDKPSIQTITSGSPISNEGCTGEVSLPQSITDDLLDLTLEADSVSEQLRVLQEWVREQGFYGEVNKGSP